MTDSPFDDLIDTETILELYDRVMKDWPGDPGYRDDTPGCVDRSLNAAWNAELYEPMRDVVQGLAFAGYVLFYLVRNNCFLDGNKRIAWISSMHTLLQLSLTVKATQDESDAYMKRLASEEGKHVTGAEVVMWLARHIEAVG